MPDLFGRSLLLIAVASAMAAIPSAAVHAGPAPPDSSAAVPDAPAVPADSSDADLFRSAIAGLEIRKPDSWHFANLESVLEHRASVKMKDEEMDHAVAQLASAPLVAATRHPEPYDRLNPSFQILVRPLGPLAEKSPVEILVMVERSLAGMFADYRLVATPTGVEVGGQPGARMTAAYTVATEDGREFPTRSTLVMIRRGNVLYQLGFSAPPDGEDAFTTEVEDILATVKFLD